MHVILYKRPGPLASTGTTNITNGATVRFGWNGTSTLLEPKARNEMDDPDVLAKRDAAVKWCQHASDYAKIYRGKPWKYLLFPNDAVLENMTIDGFAVQFSIG
jgi:hypothetical protein